MIDHERAQELSAAALDFALAPEDREELQRHLDTCPACRILDERIRADARAVADATAYDAPEGLRARILGIAGDPRAVEAAAAGPTGERRAARAPRVLSIVPPRYRRSAALLAAAAVVVALVGGTMYWRGSPTAGPGVAGASPSAAAPSASGSPTPSGQPGSPVDAEIWKPIADMTADDAPGGVVALASGFRLASLDGTPAAELAARLQADPPITFTVAPDADGRSARITPSEPLTAGAVYRFTLTAADGRTLDSWAFQAHQPLRIVGTLPGDGQTDVPLKTGIEITFDQDGVVDPSSHMTISPKVDGRFEEHGRVLAFVPAKPLKAATIYTVSVARGIEVRGTGQILEADVHFSFETARSGAAKVDVTFKFQGDLVESATADRPTIGLWSFQDWDDEPEPPPVASVRIEVHRLRDLDAAVDAYRQVRSSPDWARWAAVDLVPTPDQDRIVAIDTKLRDSEGITYVQLPDRLAAGWYVVTIRTGTRPTQAILQVTDIAGYLVVSETQTLVWANDLASGKPVAGATVAVGGTELGRTDADGLRIEKTPAGLSGSGGDQCTDGCFPVVTVRSGDRATILPANDAGQTDAGDYGWDGWVDSEGARYWRAFDTDRTLYRRTDTVNVWGVVRDRESGTVPTALSIRLYAVRDDGQGDRSPAIATTEVRPNAIGAFSGSIGLRDFPEGWYEVTLRAGGDIVATRSIQIDRILKPAYRLEVTTGRRVYFQGDQVKVTATATFYEGSPVPGVPLRLGGIVDKTFTTDKTGTATHRFKIGLAPDSWNVVSGQPDQQSVYVTPARAEEGEIAGASREILVFPSSWTIDADAQIQNGRVVVTGNLHAVDRDRLEREIAASGNLGELDPAGDPISGKTVAAAFTESIPYRVQTGTRYDFIEKTVVPVYDVGSNERAAGTIRVSTKQDGSFSASIPVSADSAGHSFSVRLSATDPDKHIARWYGWASEPVAPDGNPEPSLALTSDASITGDAFGIGEQVDVTMTDPGTAHGSDRYLFTTARQGLRTAEVQASARFRTTLAESDPPGIFIDAVRFTGSGYVPSPTFQATFRQSDRAITVALTTDAPRYAPGADVTMTVTTRDRTGKPVPSTVVLRAVDEKLFSMGGAEVADPLNELYVALGSGIIATYRSHREPSEATGADTGGGDGDGGDGRQDFKDSVLFREVDTGDDGRAVVTFRVADDLTSWHVSASAFAPGPMAGEGSIAIPVGLPFFVDATIAPEYLVSDKPSIGFRAYGTALSAGEAVTFAVDSDSLGLHQKGLKAKAFETATVALPKLTVGTHDITVTASTGSGTSARRDIMTRTFTVVPSRLTRARTDYVELTGSTRLEGGEGLVDVVVSDVGAGRFIPLLLGLTGVESARLERNLAAAVAATLATDRFDLDDPVAPTEFEGDLYQTGEGGLAILPYAGSDLEASALAALVAPNRFDVDRLEAYLSEMAGSAKETRERRNVALAGLGGLHAAVLPRIRAAAADPALTVRERLWLALGAAALGDAATARSIGASLVAEYGEVTSEHARLRVGNSPADITAGTALMALLAAANGDPLAPRLWAYVEADPGTETTYALHAVGYVTRMLERSATGAATFAYTIGGTRKVVELEAGETFRMSVTAAQLASLTIEPVTGRIGVATSWRETVKPSAFAKDPDITVSRRMTPSGTIGTAALVTVDLTIRLGSKAPKGCHLVTDIIPSGLLAVGHLRGWVDPDSGEPAPGNVDFPYAQTGQRVSFCADRATNKGVVHLRYVARVVTAGTYTWEPTVVESRTVTGSAALTPSKVITIR